MTLEKRDNEIWFVQDRYSVHLLTYENEEIKLQPIDPVMARKLRLDTDENHFIKIHQ